MVKHSHVPILKIRDRNLPAHTQKRKEGSKHRLQLISPTSLPKSPTVIP
jgi:hypothetical protein